VRLACCGGVTAMRVRRSFRNFSAPPGSCSEAVCNAPVPGCWLSDDHGRTMRRGQVLSPPPAPPSEYIKLDEPQLGRLSNGTLLLVGHSDALSPGRNTLAMASSHDNGLSFGELHKIPQLVQPVRIPRPAPFIPVQRCPL